MKVLGIAFNFIMIINVIDCDAYLGLYTSFACDKDLEEISEVSTLIF